MNDVISTKKPNPIEVGTITTDDGDGGQHEYKFAMLIEFHSAADLNAAISSGRVEFKTFGE